MQAWWAEAYSLKHYKSVQNFWLVVYLIAGLLIIPELFSLQAELKSWQPCLK